MKPKNMTHEEQHEHAMREIELSRAHVGMMFRVLAAQRGVCRVEQGTADCVVREMVEMEEAQ